MILADSDPEGTNVLFVTTKVFIIQGVDLCKVG